MLVTTDISWKAAILNDKMAASKMICNSREGIKVHLDVQHHEPDYARNVNFLYCLQHEIRVKIYILVWRSFWISRWPPMISKWTIMSDKDVSESMIANACSLPKLEPYTMHTIWDIGPITFATVAILNFKMAANQNYPSFKKQICIY